MFFHVSLQSVRSAAAIGFLGLFLCTGQSPLSSANEPASSTSFPADRTTQKKAETDLDQAWLFYRRGDWDRALNTFDRAITAEPKSPLPHVGRAYVLNAQHKYDEGTTELWQAIRLNPGDVGPAYDPLANSKKPLSADALRHGEEQLRKMLKDRPAMVKYVTPNDTLWKWALRKFAGEDVDVRVYWDSSEPTPLTSDSRRIAKGGPFAICVRATAGTGTAIQPRNFDDLWSDIVFQLYKIAPSLPNQAPNAIDKTDAVQKTLEEFNLGLLEAEEVAAQKTRAFYLKLYLPWLRSQKNLGTNPGAWHFYAFPPMGDKRARLAYWQASPRWTVDADWYDLACVDEEYRKSNIEKSREILRSVTARASKLTRWQLASLHYCEGRLYLREGKPQLAIDEFSKSIALWPLWANAMVARGMLLFELPQQFDRAIADYDAAIRLDPNQSDWFFLRGYAWHRKKDLTRAIADYTQAIRLNAKDHSAYFYRGTAWSEQGNDAKALADWRESVLLAPNNRKAQANLGWLLATSPEKDLRNGVEAVEAATKGCELSEWKDWRIVSVLAYALAEAGNFDEAVKRMEQAIKLAEGADETSKKEMKDRLELFRNRTPFHFEPKANPDLGWEFYHRGEWEKALQVFDKSKTPNPKSPLPDAGCGCVLIAQRKFDEGIEAMWQAIRLNPNDLGVAYDPNANSKKSLSAEALRHGEEQVRKMLRDRPAMAKHVSPTDELWKWTVRKFAGEDVDGLVDWSPIDPKQRTAVCFHDGKRFSIQISPEYGETRTDQSRSFDDLWSDAVYELHNIVSLSKGDAIGVRVMQDKMTCEEYNIAVFELEKAAAEQTRAFYLKFYLPWLRKRTSVVTDPIQWHCSNFPPTDNRLEQIKYWQTFSAWGYNSNNYSLICANREYQRGNFEKARSILQSLKDREQKLSSTQASDMHYLWGCLYEFDGDPKRAIEEFTKALETNPEKYDAALDRGRMLAETGNRPQAIEELTKLIEERRDWPEVYYSRGLLYHGNKQFDKAIADFNTAIRIAADQPKFFIARGDAWYFDNDPTRATADYTEAIRLGVKNASVYCRRAFTWEKQEKYSEAISDWREAIRIEPDLVDAQSNLALLLMTCADEKLRNAEAAIEPATKACELTDWKDWSPIDTLATALAEAGKFDEAVKRMEQAIKLAVDADETSKKELKDRLELYKRRRAAHAKEKTPGTDSRNR